MEVDRYRVKPGQKVKLDEWDPNEKSLFDGNKEQAEQICAELNKRLEALQELLYAEHKHKLLIVVQAMDTGGKDGVIQHVFEGVNPQGVKVTAFKVPTPQDLAHDYLWRIHPHTPGAGEIAIFNRSHYEDVLIVRVHKLAPEEVWKRRYDHINAFEKILADEGTTILKFYLHIDKDEQKKRLQARLNTPTKIWKFAKADLEERKLWPDYMDAYENVLNKTSTDYAPWYIVPANHKWYRDLVVSHAIINALETLKMSYPAPETGLDQIVIE